MRTVLCIQKGERRPNWKNPVISHIAWIEAMGETEEGMLFGIGKTKQYRGTRKVVLLSQDEILPTILIFELADGERVPGGVKRTLVAHPGYFLDAPNCPFCGGDLRVSVLPTSPHHRLSAMCLACGITVRDLDEGYYSVQQPDVGVPLPRVAAEVLTHWDTSKPVTHWLVNRVPERLTTTL